MRVKHDMPCIKINSLLECLIWKKTSFIPSIWWSSAPRSQIKSAPTWSLTVVADCSFAEHIQFKAAFILIPSNRLLIISVSNCDADQNYYYFLKITTILHNNYERNLLTYLNTLCEQAVAWQKLRRVFTFLIEWFSLEQYINMWLLTVFGWVVNYLI